MEANILITGTPGTGKSTLSKALSAELPDYTYINISEYANENKCISKYDKRRDTYVLDEDQLLDLLEVAMSTGKYIVEYHSSDLFPERWFKHIYCLSTDTDVLYDRLKARNYSTSKIAENVQCEIMQVCLEEAKESYKIVHSLKCNNEDHLSKNVEFILSDL